MTAFVECVGGDLTNVAAIESLVIEDRGTVEGYAVVIVAASGNRYTYVTGLLDHGHGVEVAGILYGVILGDEEARPLPAPTWDASQAG